MSFTFLTDKDKVELVGKIDKNINFKEPQSLTEEEQAQARENIGINSFITLANEKWEV